MKYAAFSLVGEPGKTRVGSISPDGMQVEEFDLGVDVSEDGVVALLRAELKGKLPKPIATHAYSNIRLLAPVPRPRRNIYLRLLTLKSFFALEKIIMSMLKNFLIAALMGAQNQGRIYQVTLSSLPSRQNLLLDPIPMSLFPLLYQQPLITKLS